MPKFENPVKISNGGITVWPNGFDSDGHRIDRTDVAWEYGPPASAQNPEQRELTTRGTASFGRHKFVVKAGMGEETLPWMTVSVSPYIDYSCDFSFEEIE